MGTKISGMPAASDLVGAEFPIIQGGANKRAAGSLIVSGGYRAGGILAQSGLAVSCPADTNEDILASVTIPGGVMGANGILRVLTLWTFTSDAINSKTLRVRFGGIGGTQYLNFAATSTVALQGICMIRNRNAENAQIGFAANNNNPFNTAISTANPTSAVDTTVNSTLVITGQKASAGNTLTLEAYTVELLVP